MRVSKLFGKTLRDNPKHVVLPSHGLMLRSGMICQKAAGIYSWLPMGFEAIKNISAVIHAEMDRVDAQRVSLPVLQSTELWEESGRLNAYGDEIFRLRDRQGKTMLMGPTCEELATRLFRDNVDSYRNLPMILYQIQEKFRDEIRPRHGVVRSREFLMKDAYSFDMSPEEAEVTYYKMYASYHSIFSKLGINVVPVAADTGEIGGKISHEFIAIAKNGGDTTVAFDSMLLNPSIVPDRGIYDDPDRLVAYFNRVSQMDAMTVEKGVDVPPGLTTAKGFEIGHVFLLGDRYTAPANVTMTDSEGRQAQVYMGSYGIGVSRLVAAIIEANHDENGIVWPDSIAPYRVGLLNLDSSNAESTRKSEHLYAVLRDADIRVLYDDRTNASVGNKLKDMDLRGMPWQVRIGHRNAGSDSFEVKNRRTGAVSMMSQQSLVDHLKP